jgi:hypothetical protein
MGMQPSSMSVDRRRCTLAQLQLAVKVVAKVVVDKIKYAL